MVLDERPNVNDAIQSFLEGRNYDAAELFGAHKTLEGSYVFRVWAPRARRVSLAGDFNDWSETANPMENIGGGIWQTTVHGLERFSTYKYFVEGADGSKRMKADPYGTHMETKPSTGTKIFDVSEYEWKDSSWMRKRIINRFITHR